MRTTGSDYLKRFLIIFFSVFIVGYFIFNFRIFIAGPDVIITHPQNGAVLEKDLIEVLGKATNINYISINDRAIFIDENGNFKELLLLSSGYNIIVIKAKDKFEREISKKIEVTFKGESVSHESIINIDESLSTSTQQVASSTTSQAESEVEN